MNKFHLIFTLVAASIISCQANAMEPEAEPWSLEADRIISSQNPRQIIAEGDVVLEHREESSDRPLKIRSDTITFHANDSVLDARGNVQLQERNGLVSADSIILDLNNNRSRLNSASISLADHQLFFSSRLVEKTSESRYLFRGGLATSCRIDEGHKPDWAIGWGEADITVDGMAFLKHATFRIKDIPVLYIPYLILPAKITRQTGFLFPEFSHSDRDGTGTIFPFFVNLSPSSDLTLYPGYYGKRGAFSGMEMRVITSDNSRMTLAANYLNDRTADLGPPGSEGDYRKDGFLRNENDRYWIRGKADHYFSDNVVMLLDIDSVSDQDLLLEFDDGVTGFSSSNDDFISDFNRGLQEASLSFRESTLQFTGRGIRTSGGLEMRYVDDKLSDLTGIEPVHTLPRAVLNSRITVANLPVDLSWGSEYVYYRPEEGIAYQRLDLVPKLIMAMPLGRSIEGALSSGMRETIYRVETVGSPPVTWSSSPNKNRNSWNVSANIATILTREYSTSRQHKLSHFFRPTLLYQFIESSDQSDLPDLDGSDRLAEGNSITLELNNYFSSRDPAQSFSPARQIGHFKLSQSYDINEGKREIVSPGDRRRPYSDLTADLEIRPDKSLSLRYLTSVNIYGRGVTSYEFRTIYHNNRQDLFDLNYTYIQGDRTDLVASSRIQLTSKISIGYSTTRSLLNDHKNSESLSLVYSPQCWQVELKASEDDEDQRLMINFSLTGLGEKAKTNRSSL